LLEYAIKVINLFCQAQNQPFLPLTFMSVSSAPTTFCCFIFAAISSYAGIAFWANRCNKLQIVPC
jgi:hypothetical protein